MTDTNTTPPSLETGVSALLPLEWLHVDPEITCRWRGKTEPGLVKLIAQAFRVGADVEPAKVAMLNGRWTLIDGLHRYEAFAQAAETDGSERHRFPVVSIGKAESAQQARWWASRANWTVHKPLTRRERRDAFRRYVQAGAHRKGERRRGNPKSYREMAAELPGTKHTTLRDWMIADFPAVAATMSKDPESTNTTGGLRDWREVKAERQAAQLRDRLIALGSSEATLEVAKAAAAKAYWKLAGAEPRATPPDDGYCF
ncbi:hypothetical protein L2D00_11415 [Hyphomonadaceae bacterium BL14]|nr:hypothetical protein L2D00_11415 [Hyphomonadaceae bacterium BL14]